MKWRIVVSLLGLVPIVLQALADGKLSESEAAEIASALVEAVRALKL